MFLNNTIITKENSRKAAKALIFFKGKYLFLLRSAKDNVRPLEWDIPGGGIEPGESKKEALIREVKEETGLDISSCRAIQIKEWQKISRSGKNISGTDFLCFLNKPGKIRISKEHILAKWFSQEKILSHSKTPEWLKETISLAAKALSVKVNDNIK
jgi:8-oxo-dGTP diphosphatase